MRFALAVMLGLSVSIATAATLEKVAVEGDPAPDPGFFYHHRFYRPSAGDAAGARVAAVVRLIPASGRYCIVKFDPGPGPDTIVACRRDTSPDGFTFSHLYDPTIAAGGTAAWAAKVTLGKSGVYRGDPSVVDLVGDPVPGGTGLLRDYRAAAINDAGDVVFAARISGGATVGGVTIDRGLFRCTGGDGNCSTGSGTLETLVLVNDAVPDRPGRRLCTLDSVAASTFGISFQAGTRLDCSNGAEPVLDGVFRLPFGGAVETVALETEPCQPVPAPGGTVYGAILGPSAIANTGVVGFRARTTGILVNYVLYRCDPATCPTALAEVAVQVGNQDDEGNAFLEFSVPGVSDAGDLAFQARAGDRKRVTGIYVAHPGGDIEALARVGDPVPGVSPAAAFVLFDPPTMSPAGRVAFKAKVRAEEPPLTKREGLFLWE